MIRHLKFVYPFTLEPHILTLETSRRCTFAAHTARREAYFRFREEEKERRKRDALRRIAPGFEPDRDPLIPTKGTISNNLDGTLAHGKQERKPRDVMDELVEQLAALD